MSVRKAANKRGAKAASMENHAADDRSHGLLDRQPFAGALKAKKADYIFTNQHILPMIKKPRMMSAAPAPITIFEECLNTYE